jgi:hypothetical protein
MFYIWYSVYYLASTQKSNIDNNDEDLSYLKITLPCKSENQSHIRHIVSS